MCCTVDFRSASNSKVNAERQADEVTQLTISGVQALQSTASGQGEPLTAPGPQPPSPPPQQNPTQTLSADPPVATPTGAGGSSPQANVTTERPPPVAPEPSADPLPDDNNDTQLAPPDRPATASAPPVQSGAGTGTTSNGTEVGSSAAATQPPSSPDTTTGSMAETVPPDSPEDVSVQLLDSRDSDPSSSIEQHSSVSESDKGGPGSGGLGVGPIAAVALVVVVLSAIAAGAVLLVRKRRRSGASKEHDRSQVRLWPLNHTNPRCSTAT